MGCSVEAIEGELFCREHIHITAQVDRLECPRGCGPMSYLPVGWDNQYWIIGCMIIFFVLSGDIILATITSISIFYFGRVLYLKSASFRFSCKKCEGVLLDNKSIVSLRNSKISDFSGKLMIELDNSIESSGIKCPGCEVNMARIPISYVTPDSSSGNLLIDMIRDAVPNTMEHMELDGCRDCGLIWFDKGEMWNLSSSETMRGEYLGESGRNHYKESVKTRRAFEGKKVIRNDGKSVNASTQVGRKFTYCSMEGCNALSFRNLEYCHRHK